MDVVHDNSPGMYFFRQGNSTVLNKVTLKKNYRMVMVHPSNSQKEKQELINSQLKQQSSMKRIPVSDAIASLLVRFILLF